MLIGADTTSWYIGLGLGAVVVVVAVIIVLAKRIAGQAETANDAVDVVREQTDELGGVAKINDSGVRILHAARALRKAAVGH